MRWIIEGYGSIGTRHASLLRQMGEDLRLVTRREDVPFHAYRDARSAIEDFRPDYYLICVPTADHIKSLRNLMDLDFQGVCAIEKPLGLNAAECAPSPSFPVFVTFNMRFHPIIERIREELGNEPLVAARFSVGQYLPDWRPGRDYAKVYSAIRAQGGGVLRDLSHELDLAQYFCGKARRLAAMSGTVSDLEIDTEDWVSVLMEMENCPAVNVHLDYLDRNAHRALVLLSNTRTFSADLWHNRLTINGKTENFNIERNDSFKKQLDMLIRRDFSSLCDFEAAKGVMCVIDAIEEAASQGKWVNVQ